MKDNIKANKYKWLLGGILILGFWFRIVGVNWDSYQHLNPDERFLTMVLTDMKWPGLSDFFKTSVSTYNPINVGYDFFVYGTLPLFVNKLISAIWLWGDYNGYLIIGRITSAGLDTLTIAVVFGIGKRVGKFVDRDKDGNGNLVGLVAALFYSMAVIPIQNSHFFIVDVMGNFLGTLTLLLALKFIDEPKKWLALLMGGVFGLAIACKLSLWLLLPAIGFSFFVSLSKTSQMSRIRSLLICGGIFLISAYACLRVGMPYAFKDFSLLIPDERFIANVKTVSGMVKGTIDMPPSIQWARTNFIWPIQEIAIWGWGWFVGLVIFLALGWVTALTIRTKNKYLIMIFVGLLVPFGYQALLLAKAQRYFWGAYPILSLFVGMFFVANRQKAFIKILFTSCVLISFIWTLEFQRIYIFPHSRVTASEWMNKAIPQGSMVGWELWDDPLPLILPGHAGGEYPGVEMGLYDDENPQKRDRLVEELVKSDFISISSNRLYGSIPKIPERYPLATKYYQLLFSGKLGFTKIAEFVVYPGIFNFRVNDDLAEEPFTVYDHPKVTIFMKNDDFSIGNVRDSFSQIDFQKVRNTLPKDLPASSWSLNLSSDYK